jgi:hypothetical protein
MSGTESDGYTIFLTEEEASWLAHVCEQIRADPSEREGISDRKYAPAVWAKLDAAVPASSPTETSGPDA